MDSGLVSASANGLSAAKHFLLKTISTTPFAEENF